MFSILLRHALDLFFRVMFDSHKLRLVHDIIVTWLFNLGKK